MVFILPTGKVFECPIYDQEVFECPICDQECCRKKVNSSHF